MRKKLHDSPSSVSIISYYLLYLRKDQNALGRTRNGAINMITGPTNQIYEEMLIKRITSCQN